MKKLFAFKHHGFGKFRYLKDKNEFNNILKLEKNLG